MPLARRQRRGQPWEARPAHAGLHPGHADQGSSNERRPVQRRASFSPEVVQLAATASRVPYGHRQKAIGGAATRFGGHSYGSWRLRGRRGGLGLPVGPRLVSHSCS